MIAMSVPLALQDPVLRRFPLRAIRVPAAGGTYRFVAPRASDERLARAVRPRGEPPYWADVWPASIALFRSLLRGAPLARGTCAVDLGCGIGLAGVAAGLRGARVVFADRAPEALAFAEFNARSLGVGCVESLVFDWERDPLPADVSLLLLADVVYQYRNVRPLVRRCDEVLARGGRVLCADPERPTANDLFVELAARGASIRTVAAEDPGGGPRTTVRIADVSG